MMKMKTIVCPTDFSTCSKNAALYAAELAKEFNSLLILIHVYESPVEYAEEALVAVREIDKAMKTGAEKDLLKLKNLLLSENSKLRIETVLKEGVSAKEIRKLADKVNADLVVMGNTGKGQAERIFIGSTSSQLISKTQCPVLCIPKGKKYNGIGKIIYATDLKEDNILAALEIVPFAKQFKAEIVFVFVDGQHLIHSDENISDMTKKIRSHIKYTKMSGYIAKNTSVTSGIEYFLKKNPADLLVMFTHQKHFPASIAHPSVTRKMSHKVKIPFLALTVPDRSLTGVS